MKRRAEQGGANNFCPPRGDYRFTVGNFSIDDIGHSGQPWLSPRVDAMRYSKSISGTVAPPGCAWVAHVRMSIPFSPKVICEPIGVGQLRYDFPDICKRAGVPAIRFHDLRHTHATLLHERRVPRQSGPGASWPRIKYASQWARILTSCRRCNGLLYVKLTTC